MNKTRPPLRRARPGSVDMPAPWIAGVCSGLAVHTGKSIKTIRWGIALTSFTGIGAVLYIWLWLTVAPDSQQADTKATRLQRNLTPMGNTAAQEQAKSTTRGQLLIAGISFLAAALLVLLSGKWDYSTAQIVLPAAAIVIGLLLVWTQAPNLNQWKKPQVLALVGLGILLVVTGAIFLVARNDPLPILLRGMLIGLVVVIGITAALLPLWLRTFQDIRDANAAEARETERANIAAHLHDSVLQTLTLIRANADNPTRIKSLALHQERELRAWLYTGHEKPAESVAGALQEIVTAAEATHGLETQLVTVGDTTPGPAELAAIAACGEALTNAMRHGKPPITIYMETRPTQLDIFVKDAGPGFDPTNIPPDRHGVTDSIIGRTNRVGGTTKYRTLNPGTEVQISVPLTTKDPK